MKTIEDSLKNNLKGLYYGNRILLPFNCYLLKVIIEDDIIMDFSPNSKSIYVHEEDNFTEIYFKQFKNIKDTVSKYETIKLIAVEKAKDIFNFDNHYKLAVHIEEEHKLTIEKTDEDILFIE
ncbi:MAG: hypothetical protein M1480_18155 [Bacteroidetes bacterium]|nr:hypothetical protein [Bacteroidota bacterium]